LDASDPAAVDEKFWGDEKGPENGDDKANKDSPTEQNGESEVVAKEGGKKSEPEQNESAEKNDKPSEPPLPDVDGEEEIQPEADGEDSTHPDVNGAPMDEHVPEADTLELPDDMNLDTEKEADEVENLELDEVEKEEDDLMDVDEPVGDLEQRNDTEQEQTQEPEPKDTESLQQAERPDDDQGSAEEDNSAVAQPDITNGEGEANDEQSILEKGQDSSGETGTSMGIAGNAATVAEDTKDKNG
jgi:midasin